VRFGSFWRRAWQVCAGNGWQCKIPKLAGDTLAAAKKALKHANCGVGTVKQVISKKVKKGRVISSSPKAGTTHKAGTKVSIAVSRGSG
jgi:beta-lactam-binding protein with PASTA domain